MHGGVHISISLLFFLIAIGGIVGVLKKKQIFVKVFGAWIAASMGFWITEILITVAKCDDFSISSELAWTLIIAYVVFLIGMLSYFFICVYSLRLKLRKDEEEKKPPSSSYSSFVVLCVYQQLAVLELPCCRRVHISPCQDS